MRIRQEKIKLMTKMVKEFNKKFEYISSEIRMENKVYVDPNVDVEKLLDPPDIELKFPEYSDDQNLLPEAKEETVMAVQTGRDSQEDLKQMMLDFEVFCSQLRRQEQESLAPAVAGIPETLPGTPTKRPASVARADDTPSKRRRIISSLAEAEKEQETDVQESVEEGIQRMQLDEVQEPEQLIEGVQLPEIQQIPPAEQFPGPQQPPEENVSLRPRRRRGLQFVDEQTNLSHRWLQDFTSRTDSYMRPSLFNELRFGKRSKPLPAKFLLKEPGIMIQNEDLRDLFAQNFENVEYVVEEQDSVRETSPERSPQQRQEKDEQKNEEFQGDHRQLKNDESPEEPRPHQEPSNLMESLQGVAPAVNDSDERRETMGRMSVHSACFSADNNTLATSPQPPCTFIDDTFAAEMQNPLTENQPEGLQQDAFARRRELRFWEDTELEESETSHVGITQETIFQMILFRLAADERDFVDLVEIIPPDENNKNAATWAFNCVLELQKKKKIVMSQDGPNAPIYVRKYPEAE